jgi:hypothetical protein
VPIPASRIMEIGTKKLCFFMKALEAIFSKVLKNISAVSHFSQRYSLSELSEFVFLQIN